tara:strand:- start:1861 stop:3183 length:1323 start_codon:yes stop_codon:yes gene_type:complete
MTRYIEIAQSEFVHLVRSPFKTISLILFGAAVIYGCQNGYDLFKTHSNEIISIQANNDKSIANMILQYEEIEQGTIDKPRRDPTIPYWAVWNTPSHAFKYPSPMMVFSLGQSEQYGYYKRVTNWSTIFDSDLAEEIANPERMAIGTLDLNFVLIYLTPILIIILLFNIGGLEKDLRFDNLIYLNNISKERWLLARFSFYYLLTVLLIFMLITPYALFSGVLQSASLEFFNLLLIISLYLLIWFTTFFFINVSGNGSSDHALKMISVWLVFCIIIPGAIHQISSLKYPTNYMTDYLDVSRDQSNKIFELPSETLREELLKAFPSLQTTLYATDTSMNKAIINRSLSGLVNILNKDVARTIEWSSEKKNKFIKSYSRLNPVIYFQNEINALTDTDYYAYKKYRSDIQEMIDIKINLILEDTWNKVTVDKEKYIQYVESFKKL